MAVTSEERTADLREPAGWRRTKNRIATILMYIAFVVVIIPLGFVLYTTIAKGISIISWQFLTSPIPPVVAAADEGGVGPAVLGTLEITALATVIAVPLGVLGAVYLNEYGGTNWLSKLIGFMADVMTGVPSIVMGLFIFSIWVLHFGFSGLAGAFALGCLMLPIVIRSTYEMLLLVPDALREGSYALGASKSRVTLTVVLPAAAGGIVSGCLLAVARAAGETAPLLFTAAATMKTNFKLSEPMNSLPVQIYNDVISPTAAVEERAWGAALTLVVMILLLNLFARLVARRSRIA